VLFNSLTFVVFFAAVAATYWNLGSWSARKTVLLVASYVFYGAWNPPFVLLLAFSTLVDFWAAQRMAGCWTPGARRGWLAVSLVSNLGLLGYFKYSNFLLGNLQSGLAQVGVSYVPPHLDVILPVGISFYTFQTLSYTIDVYRGRMPASRSWRDFALYVAFFPQLVAGPIVRAVDFMPQCEVAPRPVPGRFAWGLWLMTLGLFQKVVLADTLMAPAAQTVFGFTAPLLALDAWSGVLAFSAQIFFDFAGYSTCAIGAALCLGFALPDNFRAPYAAIGFSDFWRRWHISLSSFLRDYLYIPLGGNRAGVARASANLIIVMLLGGLWHGAGWTFVAWGLLHGIYLVVERLIRVGFRGRKSPLNIVEAVGGALLTYGAICVAWVFFRAPDFATAWSILQSMAGQQEVGYAVLPTREMIQVGVVTVVLMLVHAWLRNNTIEQVVARMPRWCLVAGWVVMGGAIILNQGSGDAFIYFQF
jgi:alginate O-acetyltransferase complex protein AlgI